MTTWWQRHPLRLRLALWYAIVGTLLLAGFSATLYFYVSSTLARPLGHQLRVDLNEVVRRVEVRNGDHVYWDLTAPRMSVLTGASPEAQAFAGRFDFRQPGRTALLDCLDGH